VTQKQSGAVDQPMSTTEALRRALGALGPDAQVQDIIDYAREHFGLDAGERVPAPPPTGGQEPARKGPPRRKGRGSAAE
jgi:hypothetical protein